MWISPSTPPIRITANPPAKMAMPPSRISPFGNYLLYEVKAPAGYKLPTDPVRVTVEAGMVTFYNVEGDKIDEIQLPSGGEGEDSTGEAATIPNKEQEKLPLLGAWGASLVLRRRAGARKRGCPLIFQAASKRGRNKHRAG